MVNSPFKLYLLLAVACLAGYGWLFYDMQAGGDVPAGGCLVKRVTHLPCPSCGSTHAVQALFQGDIMGSLLWNPFGILISIVLLVTPVWLAYDVLLRKQTLYGFYRQVEKILQQKQVAIPAITLVIANWIWNIYKGV
jgi:hypothetical protein